MDQFCVDVDKWFLSNTRKSVHVDNDLYNAFVVLKIICYFHRNNVMFGVSNSSDTSSSSNKPYKTGLLDFMGYYKTYNQLCGLGFNLEEIETLKSYNLHKVLMYDKDIETVLATYGLRSDNMLKKCTGDDAKSQYRIFMVDYRTNELPMIDYLRFFINLGNTEDVGTILLHITEGELVEPAELLHKLLTSSRIRPDMVERVLTDFHKAHDVFMSQEYQDMLFNSCQSGARFKYSCSSGKKYIMLCNESREEMDDNLNKRIIADYCDMS